MPRSGVRRPLIAVVVVIAGLAVSGCTGTARDAAPGSSSGPGSAAPAGPLTIFAAASLGAAFDELAEEFERRHPGVDVRPISYDGSSTLATQLIEGAPADVFASADERSMQRVVDAGLVGQSRLFASNTLVIAVPAGNPAAIASVDDLDAPGLAVVLCAPEVPCGAASAALLDRNGVAVAAASLEQNVTAVLTKIAAGEADAGLVYATDVRRADVEAIEAAGAADVVNRYPVAALSEAANLRAAEAFVDFAVSARGRAVLERLGFGAP